MNAIKAPEAIPYSVMSMAMSALLSRKFPEMFPENFEKRLLSMDEPTLVLELPTEVNTLIGGYCMEGILLLRENGIDVSAELAPITKSDVDDLGDLWEDLEGTPRVNAADEEVMEELTHTVSAILLEVAPKVDGL